MLIFSVVGGTWTAPIWPTLPDRKGQNAADKEIADFPGFKTSEKTFSTGNSLEMNRLVTGKGEVYPQNTLEFSLS